MQIVLAIIFGFFFGFVLYWVGAASPKKLIAMLRLENLTIMKIIAFSIGFSSVMLAIFGLLGLFNPEHLSVKTMNLGVLTGAVLFGIGFGTVATCPGTCVAAAGSGGYKKAVSALLGGLLGTWIFAMTYGYWKSIGLFSTMDWGKLTLFHISDKYESVFSWGFGGLFLVGLVFIVCAFFIPVRAIKKED